MNTFSQLIFSSAWELLALPSLRPIVEGITGVCMVCW